MISTPASMASMIRSSSTVLVTAMSLISETSRRARKAAPAMALLILWILAFTVDSIAHSGKAYGPNPFQYIYNLAQGKSHDICIRAVYLSYEEGAHSLHGVSSRLVVRFLRPYVPRHFIFWNFPEADRR